MQVVALILLMLVLSDYVCNVGKELIMMLSIISCVLENQLSQYRRKEIQM